MLKLQHNIDAAIHRFERALPAVKRELARGLERGAREFARKARARAPKADSTLVNAILAHRDSDTEWTVAAGVEHGVYVERGTGDWGDYGRASGRMPPVESLHDWIKRKRIQPDDPDMSQWELAFLIARSIARSGTPPQPFMEPTIQEMRPRLRQLLEDSLVRGLGRLAR